MYLSQDYLCVLETIVLAMFLFILYFSNVILHLNINTSDWQLTRKLE